MIPRCNGRWTDSQKDAADSCSENCGGLSISSDGGYCLRMGVEPNTCKFSLSINPCSSRDQANDKGPKHLRLACHASKKTGVGGLGKRNSMVHFDILHI